jgi:hypothetical protein
MRHEQRTIAAIEPGHMLPAQPERLFWPHTGVGEHSGDGRQWLGCDREVARFFFGANDALAPPFARQHLLDTCSQNSVPMQGGS